MPRISMVDPASATGKTKEFLDSLKKDVGRVPNIFKVIAHSSAAVQMFSGIKQALSKGLLPQKTKEGISLVSATVNKCKYCLAAHTAIGKLTGLSPEEIGKNKNADSGDPRTKAILQFARSVIINRGAVSDADYRALTDAGVSESETIEIISEICLNIFTNYINNVADTKVDF